MEQVDAGKQNQGPKTDGSSEGEKGKKMFDINLIKQYVQDKQPEEAAASNQPETSEKDKQNEQIYPMANGDAGQPKAGEQSAVEGQRTQAAASRDGEDSFKRPLTEDELTKLKARISGHFSDEEFQNLQPVELKAMSIFFDKHPNVDLVERIKGTAYALFRLNRDKMRALLDFIEEHKGTGPGMPQVSQNEIHTFRFGAIRSATIPYAKYDHNKHKAQYDKLATFIMEHCQEQMRSQYGLGEVMVPEDEVLDNIEAEIAKEELGGQPMPEDKKADRGPKSNVFMSGAFYKPTEAQKALNKTKTALVLIQGTGAVRAGIWARSVCNGANFELGSMLPQVEWALLNEYPVIVMNPNLNSVDGKRIPLNGQMQDHAYHVWKEYVEPAGFESILLIAHSAGGGCLTTIQQNFADTFYEKVKQIAYTDSWTISKAELDQDQRLFMQRYAVQYDASDRPLGTPLPDSHGHAVCPSVSAGHEKHEYTTGCAWPLIMQQFDKIKEGQLIQVMSGVRGQKKQ